MVIAILIWSALVGAIYAFGGEVLALLTPGAAWLQANPDLAAWIEPALAFAGTAGVGGAVTVWLAGVALIALFWRGRSRVPARGALSYEEWRQQDGGGAPPPRWRRRAAERYRDDEDDRRMRRRRRRDDDDDDDDDDD